MAYCIQCSTTEKIMPNLDDNHLIYEKGGKP